MTAGEKGISISSIWQVHNRETEDGVELDKDSGTTTLMFLQKEFLVALLPSEVVGRWVQVVIYVRYNSISTRSH